MGIGSSFTPPMAVSLPTSTYRKGEAKVWLSDLTVAVNFGYSPKSWAKSSGRRATSAGRSWRLGMTILQIEVEDARPVAANCDEDYLNVTLADGRVLRAPLWWYPRLFAASSAQRAAIETSPLGLHWPEIDEDVSVASILRGRKAPGAIAPTLAGGLSR
jgi:hypothetical protein